MQIIVMSAFSVSPYLFAERTNSMVSVAHILRGRQPTYHWSGTGPLSIKMFLGGMAHYRAGTNAQYAVDDSRYLVLNQGQSYTITIDSPTPVESFCLFFSDEMASRAHRLLREHEDRLLDEPFAASATPLFYERTYLHDDTLSPVLHALRSSLLAVPTTVAPEPGWVTEQLYAVLERLLLRHQETRREAAHFTAGGVRPATREELYRRLHLARDYIQASFATSLTLDEMSAVACLSPNHFLRTFKAAFGSSPHRFLTSVRLSVACRLLERTEMPVTQVCQEVGFQSPGSFSHLFTRHVGVAPDLYRKRYRSSRSR